jgi:uncharacterized protein (DUF885 family)
MMSTSLKTLYRAARVRVDIGIHTGRMTYDETVDYVCAHVHFHPGARQVADTDDEAAAVFEASDRSIYRYSKWPTQAITYNVAKKAILDLREKYKAQMGDNYSAREFHEKVMIQGTVSPLFYAFSFRGIDSTIML